MRLHTNAKTIFIKQRSCANSCIMGLECRAQRVITDETAQSSLLGARIVEEVTPHPKHQRVLVFCFVADMLKAYHDKYSLASMLAYKRRNYIYHTTQLRHKTIPIKTKKRRLHFCSRLVNSLGLEPRTPTLKVLCSTC